MAITTLRFGIQASLTRQITTAIIQATLATHKVHLAIRITILMAPPGIKVVHTQAININTTQIHTIQIIRKVQHQILQHQCNHKIRQF